MDEMTRAAQDVLAERDRLREALEAAFREGWQDGHLAREAAAACEPTWGEDAAWADSETRAALEGK